MLAEGEDLGFGFVRALRHDLHLGDALGEPERGLERVGETPLDAIAADEAIDDDLDRVLLVPRQLGSVTDHVGELTDLAVDAGSHVPLTRQVGEQRLVLSLAPAHDRREHLEARAVGKLQHPVDDLLRCLAFDARAVVRAVRHADAGVQQPQIVVDLGDRADGRPRVA